MVRETACCGCVDAAGGGGGGGVPQSDSVHMDSNSRGDCLIRSEQYNPIPTGTS